MARALDVSPSTLSGWESGRDPVGEIRTKYAYLLDGLNAKLATETEAAPTAERPVTSGTAPTAPPFLFAQPRPRRGRGRRGAARRRRALCAVRPSRRTTRESRIFHSFRFHRSDQGRPLEQGPSAVESATLQRNPRRSPFQLAEADHGVGGFSSHLQNRDIAEKIGERGSDRGEIRPRSRTLPRSAERISATEWSMSGPRSGPDRSSRSDDLSTSLRSRKLSAA
ncbi:hypothetical protein ACPCC3_33000 [Streptomyces cellulosae]